MSAPNWWGDWRPTLTPHTGNLQPTDLIECTSIVGGVPVNTAITGQQIIDATSSGGGVPYTGATNDVDLGTHSLFTAGIGIGTNTPTHELEVVSNDQCISLMQTSNGTGGGIALMDANTTDANHVGVGALGDRLCLRSNAVTYRMPTSDGTNGQVLTTDGSSHLSWQSAGPTLLGWSGILGTQTTGTAVTICHSLLIPANTLGTNNILQLVFRMYRQSGNLGQMYGRIYTNTTNSLTGATLISSTFTMNGGGTQYIGYCERNYSYDGTSLRTMVGTTYSEYTNGNIQTTAFNRSVDQYILFTMQAQNAGDRANVDLFKVFAYV